MSDDHDVEAGPPPDPNAGHERRDVSIKSVVLFGVYLTVAAVAVHVAIWVLWGQLNRAADRANTSEYPMAATAPSQLPPAPRLQVQPREEMKALRRDEERALGSYGWIDRTAGIVRLPVDRAVELVLERGLPVREQPVPFDEPPRPSKASSGRSGEATER